jgi:hypothetical protein
MDIPKAAWGDGPWQSEPDREEWVTEVGLPAIIRRGTFGSWCGYVAVPPGHPAHGAGEALPVEVHGGITYHAPCSGDICHVPAPGEPDDVWWIGFDCGHYRDLQPGIEALMRIKYPGGISGHKIEVYRDIHYVKAECEELAKQLKALE